MISLTAPTIFLEKQSKPNHMREAIIGEATLVLPEPTNYEVWEGMEIGVATVFRSTITNRVENLDFFLGQFKVLYAPAA